MKTSPTTRWYATAMKSWRVSIPVVVCALLSVIVASSIAYAHPSSYSLTAAVGISATSSPSSAPRLAYDGPIYHIFFHSLVVYPELAYKKDARAKMYKMYMVTRSDFENILESLYQNQFVLIDIHSIYSVDPTGKVSKKIPLVPSGKKPLIISLDDLNYYTSMRGRGFADKLVLDSDGRVATEIETSQGRVVTRDGDVVPLLDDFVRKHPDFSVDGAKGIIGLTGFEGILGYRTQHDSLDRDQQIAEVKPIIAALKQTGWQFGSHSYTHAHTFFTGTISLQELMTDSAQWKTEVESLVGPTDIFIGPFGQVFKEKDPRRAYLVTQGFVMFCGVGLDRYLSYFDDHVAMDRADIDDYRIQFTPQRLEPYFNANALTSSPDQKSN